MDTIRVDLKRPVWDEKKRLYRPGRGVEMPRSFAESLGLAAPAPKLPAFDVEAATKEDLVAEAERRGITVKRADGKEGEPLVSDYREALK